MKYFSILFLKMLADNAVITAEAGNLFQHLTTLTEKTYIERADDVPTRKKTIHAG